MPCASFAPAKPDRLEQLVPDLLDLIVTYYYSTSDEARAAARLGGAPGDV
jgi:hypothetical protein